METPSTHSLLQSLRWLQTSHEYSDLKIFCGNEVFQVHKAIVCSRSRYFATSCRWGKDGKLKDEIELKDEDPRLVGLMIDYLYQMDYEDLLPSSNIAEPSEETVVAPESPVTRTVSFYENLGQTSLPVEETAIDPVDDPVESSELKAADDFERSFGISKGKKDKKKHKRRKSQKLYLKDHGGDLDLERLTVDTLMYALAGKYEIEDLKALAKAKFEQAVLQDWESRAFAHAAELAFNTTHSSDQGLRSVVINTINQHRELVNFEEVQSLLDSGNGMAWALVQVLLLDHTIPNPAPRRSLFG